jgi:REP element-mobilizing transposase RayT
MHSHIHLLCKATNGFILSEVMRDFKKYTSKKIIQAIIEDWKAGEKECWIILKKLVNI